MANKTASEPEAEAQARTQSDHGEKSTLTQQDVKQKICCLSNNFGDTVPF